MAKKVSDKKKKKWLEHYDKKYNQKQERIDLTKTFALDLETTGYDKIRYLNKLDDKTVIEEFTKARCWLWKIKQVKGDPVKGIPGKYKKQKEKTGLDIESLIGYMTTLGSINVYTHNLRFDFAFLESSFQKMGKHWTDKNLKRKDEYLDRNEYVTLKSEMNTLYTAEVCLGYKQNVKFYDSAKLFPLKLEKLGEMYDIPKLSEQFDYETERPLGYQPTAEEYEYIDNAVDILIAALIDHFNQWDNILKISRSAYALFDIQRKYDWARIQDGTYDEMRYDKAFKATEVEEHLRMRHAYAGGIVYVNPRYKGQLITLKCDEALQGFVLDVTSEYPSAMRHYLMPFGEPVPYDGNYDDLEDDVKSEYNLYIATFTAKFRLKKDRIPMLPKKWGIRSKTVKSDADLVNKEMMLCSYDFENFIENYEVTEIEFRGGVMFQSMFAPFRDFVDYWADIKNKADAVGDKALRQLAKLMMNGGYGKFGESVIQNRRGSYLDEAGVVRYITIEEEMRAKSYLPMAIFICGAARDILLQTCYIILDDGGIIVYMDTDSIHFIHDKIPDAVELNEKGKSELKKWDLEGEWHEAKFLRDKCYAEQLYKYDKITKERLDETKLDIKCAGLSSEAKDKIKSLEEFKLDKWYEGTLVQKTVAGGVLLINQNKFLADDDHRDAIGEAMFRKLMKNELKKFYEATA